MNENLTPNPSSSTPTSFAGESRVRVPDTSMLPGSEKPPSAVVGMLRTAVQGAHDGIDHLAQSAEPAARQLGDGIAAAEGALKAGATQLSVTGDAWVGSLRSRVRTNPLASIAAAFALGALIARVTR